MSYTLTFYRPESATPITMLNAFRAMALTRGISRIGALSLTVDINALGYEPQLDTRIVITREMDGYSWLIGGYLVRGLRRSLNSGDESYTIKGLCYNSLTRRRVIYYTAGSSYADKTARADNMMKAVIRENLGALADTGRNIAAYGLTVEADLSLAGTVTAGFAYKNVYDVMDQIANIAESTNSERVYWDMRPTDVGWTCEFISRVGYVGADRRFPAGNNPILVSPEVGNVRAVELVSERDEEINRVLAGGQGEFDDRILTTVSDTTRMADSVINRHEGFFDGRNYETEAALASAARKLLVRGKPVYTFEAVLTETEYFKLGQSFAPGDLLTVSYAGEHDVFVRGARLTVTPDAETVDVILESI